MGLFDMFKKKENSDNNNMYLYSEEELKDYEKYIREQFGDWTGVIHEIVSPDIHLDIIVVPPTKESNYYKLITMGMGAYKMNVPNQLKQYQLERAELVMYLPATWDIKSNKEEDYWPIRQLKTLARLPIQSNSWLGLGHTVSSDANNSVYASNTDFCSMLLLFPFDNNCDPVKNLDLTNNKRINFYHLFPIYEDELKFVHENGWRAFIDLTDDSIVRPINIKRDSFVSKKK